MSTKIEINRGHTSIFINYERISEFHQPIGKYIKKLQEDLTYIQPIGTKMNQAADTLAGFETKRISKIKKKILKGQLGKIRLISSVSTNLD